MSDVPRTWTTSFGGEQFTLSLRTTEDGFISASEYVAAQLYVKSLASDGIFGANATDIDKFFTIITEEGFRGKVRRPSGEEIPLPFRSWLDLDAEVVESIIQSFFLSLSEKMTKLKTSNSSTLITRLQAVTSLFASEMKSNST